MAAAACSILLAPLVLLAQFLFIQPSGDTYGGQSGYSFILIRGAQAPG
jgi:hypothetical protein